MRRAGEDGEAGRHGRTGQNGHDDQPANSGGYNPTDIPFSDATADSDEIPIGALDTFVYPGRDERGTSAHLSFNVPPYMERAVKIVLRSHRFPYLDMGAFLRHAVVRHLHWLVSVRLSLPRSMTAMLDSISETCRDAELRIQCEDAFRQMDTIIDRFLAAREYGEASRMVAVVMKRIDDAEPSARQREFKAQFLRRFGRFLVSGRLGPEDTPSTPVLAS